MPFSENAQLMQKMANYSNVGIPGRFIFRIDEWIQPAGCLDIDASRKAARFIRFCDKTLIMLNDIFSSFSIILLVFTYLPAFEISCASTYLFATLPLDIATVTENYAIPTESWTK